MIFINYYIKPIFLFIYALIALILIGLLDFYSGAEISPLLLYLIPIYFIGMQKYSNKVLIITVSFIASIFWFTAEFYTKSYSSNSILVWNGIVRLTIFLLFGFILFQLRVRLDKLKELNQKLNSLNIEKNKFIGIAAHDLKNPIGSIMQLSNILLGDLKYSLSPDTEEITEYIKELSTNSFQILVSLLDVSKIEAGIIEIKKTNQDYILFVKKNVLINQLLANKKNIKLNFTSNFKDKFFEFDQNYLSEVLNNLLTNAIKFSYPETTVNIIIEMLNEKIIRTTIEDNGKGIPTNEHYKLFNYFQKTSTTPTNGELSTGLGLAISKKIVLEHEGTIGFESELNIGSKFYYDLHI